jgi:hypothetical protein
MNRAALQGATPMPATELRKFTFTDTTSQDLSIPGEVKKIRALEYIAHYLEGIDSSLATIAAAVTEDPGDGLTIMRALRDIVQSLKQE